jgi:hypothetical protein
MTKEIIDFINAELKIDITKKKKTNQYVFARTVYYKLAKELTNLPIAEIGRQVNKDHCSVIHNLKNFEEVVKRKELKKIYDTFKEFPIKEDRVTYTEALNINEQLRLQLTDLKQKYEQLLEEREETNTIKVSKIEELTKGLTDEQLDLVHLRLEAMIKMMR